MTIRKEPFAVGDYVHVYNRGNRKLPIFRGNKDKDRFLQSLFYFNSETCVDNPFQKLDRLGWLRSDLNQIDAMYKWPETWPNRKPIVSILAFTLMENHFHLLLKEITERGVTIFMRKIGTGFTSYSNLKHQETGRLFQGAYKAKRIDSDEYMQYLSVYIQIINTLELHPNGLNNSLNNIEDSIEWASNYRYSSLGDYLGTQNHPFIEKDILKDFFPDRHAYKNYALDTIANVNINETIEHLTFEEE
jgi:putative transposase